MNADDSTAQLQATLPDSSGGAACNPTPDQCMQGQHSPATFNHGALGPAEASIPQSPAVRSGVVWENAETGGSDEQPGVLAAALNAAQRGWPVFPIKGKAPLTAHGFHDATAEENAVRSLFQAHPGATGYGIVPPRDIAVVDVDPRHGGDATLAQLEQAHGPLPTTVAVTTGGGGSHLYFRVPSGLKLRCRTNALGMGVDIKAQGGYLVGPGSLHESGKIYAWRNPPETHQIAACPDWIIEQLTTARQPVEAVGALPEYAQAVHVGEGQRNDFLFRRASLWRRHDMPPEAILAAVQIENRQCCKPPLAAEEVRRIVDSVQRYQPAVPVTSTASGPVVLLRDLRRPAPGDQAELFQYRFLNRGGSILMVGPTGRGKSSFIMQGAIGFAAGQPCFGIVPTRPLRVLIIQAENDEGDLTEMRDGILEHLGLSDPERELALINVKVVTEDSRTGEQFVALLDRILDEHPCDLVFIDPAFAYLGGDASSQREVSPFLRNLLNPVIHRHQVGLWINHHTNKPASSKDKGAAVDLGAYVGAGSAEWCNWARGVIALQPVPNSSVFKLSVPKRGARLRWRDADGNPTSERYIAHSREPGRIYWRDADPDELPGDSQDANTRYPLQPLLNQLAQMANRSAEEQRTALLGVFTLRNPGAQRDSVRRGVSRLLDRAMREGLVRQVSGRYVLVGNVPPAAMESTEGGAE